MTATTRWNAAPWYVPLVGRRDELDALIDDALHPPAVTCVEGEAGIGKTRLVEELLERSELRWRRRLIGRCHDLRERFAFGPVIEALRDLSTAPRRPQPLSELTGTLRPLLPELAALLPAALVPLEDPQRDQYRIIRAFVELMSALGPTVCVLEDLHWADEATVELLRVLVARMPPELCLLLTFRRDDLPADDGIAGVMARSSTGTRIRQLVLDPLSRQEVGELAGHIYAGVDLPEDLVRSLQERTEGLPFAVEEVARELRERPDLAAANMHDVHKALDELPTPPLVRDVVLQRVRRLSPQGQQMLWAAAAVGMPAAAEVLAHVAGASGT